jgi:putative DNA primase/helicase
MSTTDAWIVADPIGCEICRREACEDHLPADPSLPRKVSATLRAFSLSELESHLFPARRPILVRYETPIFCAGHLGQIVGARGIGKTQLLQTLALGIAGGIEVLGFQAPEPRRVLYIDGEMSAPEIQERFASQRKQLSVSAAAPLVVLAADWQESFLPRLDTPAGQAAVEPFVEQADAIIIDNRSCLFDPESEKDPAAWQPAQDWLLSLRRCGKAVLIAHHANRLGTARGHSKSEDLLNLSITLSRPEDYSADQGARFIGTFDKCRGAHGSAVAPFAARLTPEGWQLESVEAQGRQTAEQKLCEYLRLAHEAGERPKSANAAIAGARVNRNEGLRAWAALRSQGVIRDHHEGGFFAR